jgi:hypothetical protein
MGGDAMTKFKPGKYLTRDGREAEVYRVDGVADYPLIGAVKTEGDWHVCCFTPDGGSISGVELPSDLMPPTPKASGFVNVFDGGFATRSVHVDRARADKLAKVNERLGVTGKRIACIDLSQIDLTPFLAEDEE